MKTFTEILKGVGIATVGLCAMLGLAMIIAMAITGTSLGNAFSHDYIIRKRVELNVRITAFEDSSMKYVNTPAKYNRFVDSANKYVYIYNYLKP